MSTWAGNREYHRAYEGAVVNENIVRCTCLKWEWIPGDKKLSAKACYTELKKIKIAIISLFVDYH